MTLLIILIILFLLILGFIVIYRRLLNCHKKLNFAFEYRDKFVQLSNEYFKSYDRWNTKGNLNSDLYIWLTKNVNQIQSDLGYLGNMHYVGPFQSYQVKNYQVVINTLPKFRNDNITDFDVSSCDDSLLRYIGVMESAIVNIKAKLKNPIRLFQEGFKQIVSLPIYFLNWFGILSDNITGKVISNPFYSIVTGLIGLIAFISSVITIVQGKEQVTNFINYIKNILHHI